MKKNRQGRSAFTLVEVLVVIAIISLAALALSTAVRGARRQANATKCQANMRNLHSAMVSFFADNKHYPTAASYEKLDRWFNSSGDKNETFSERRGWVAWVTSKGERRNNNGETPWEVDNKKSHANNFLYPANSDPIMRYAISEGALFKYAGKDFATYKCPDHPKTKDNKTIFLNYAMNCNFYSYNDRGYYYRGHENVTFLEKTDASRMALFIEIDEDYGKSAEDRKGQPANEKVKEREFSDDCCWSCDENKAELGRFTHRRGSQNYSHVVFLDGHVAAIPYEENKDDPEDPGWNGHANRDDVFKSLGKGSF